MELKEKTKNKDINKERRMNEGKDEEVEEWKKIIMEQEIKERKQNERKHE